MRNLGWIVALTAAWLGSSAVAAAQYCQSNADCGAGWICSAGACTEGVQVGAEVGVEGGPSAGATVQVGVPQPPPPQQQVVVQQPPVYQAQLQPVYQAQPQPVYQAQPQYYQPQPQPQPVRYVERPIWGMIGPGIGLLVGGYVVNILVSAIGAAVIGFDSALGGDVTTTADEFFYFGLVPVAGPWIQLGVTALAGSDGWAPYMIIDGLIQLTGLTLIILGATLTRREAVYADLGDGVELGFTPGLGSLRASLTF